MPKQTGQIQPDPLTHCATTASRCDSVGYAMLAAGLLGIVGWWVLRHAEWRAFLVQLVPHRYPIAFAYERQILAPRSLALAGSLCAVIGTTKILISKINNKMGRVSKLEFLTQCFVSVQALVALTVVINLTFYFIRVFRTFPCSLSEETVFTKWVPQAYPHARELRRLLPDDATVAIHAEGGTFNLYLLSAFAYPVRSYYADALDDISSGPTLHRRILSPPSPEYYLYYDPFSTTSPLRLKRQRLP